MERSVSGGLAPRKSIDLAMLPDARAPHPPLGARSRSAPEICELKQQRSHALDVVPLEMAALNVNPAAPERSTTLLQAPPVAVAPAVGAPAAWTPRELFAAVADDTFFGFLEAFNLQLSDANDTSDKAVTAVDATVIPINAYADQHGKTLLHHACRLGKSQVAKALLFHGSHTLARCHIGRTPFHDAISSGDTPAALELVQMLYAHEPRGLNVVDANGSHVVHLAAIHGCLDVIQWYAKLLESKTESTGANESGDDGDVSRDAAASETSSQSSVALVPMSITSFSGRNLLHYAAYNGRLRVLQWALSSDNAWNLEFSASALDSNGYSLLHYAAMGGHLELCEWLVNHSSTRTDLNILAKNSAGQTAFDLAKTPEVKHFVAQVSQLPPAPTNVHCIGADSSSLGIAWDVVLHSDLLLREVLAPLCFEIEYCKKPKGLTSASGFLSMVMMMPSSASPYLLRWEQLSVRMHPSAREYWLSGLERDSEYLVRMRAVNRNGCSTYTAPNLSFSEFATTGTGTGLRRILGLFPRSSSASSVLPTFIGTLHFELLEARHLHVALGKHEHARKQTDHGHFYSQITVSMAELTTATTPPARRRTVPMAVVLRKMASVRTKTLYHVRTANARIQDEMVLAGSIHAFQHPEFSAVTTFRVPEASDAALTIEIRHKTHRVDAVVGVVKIPLIDFVRGLPAKMQWLSLDSASSRSMSLQLSSPLSSKSTCTEADPICGEILLRTLFLADGITELPHPTRVDRMSSSAQELLNDCVDTSEFGGSDGSESESERFSTAGDTFDAMGFRVFDPRTRCGNGSAVTSRRVLSKSYQYYKLLQECVGKRQTQRWETFHFDAHASSCEIIRTRRSFSSRHGRHSGSSSGNGSCVCGDPLSTSQLQPKFCPYEARSSNELRLLVWNGVPASWRPKIYMRMSGALRERARHPADYFQSLLQRTTAAARAESPTNAPPKINETRRELSEWREFEAAEKQIQVDLQRTFAGNQCWINSADGQRALERVLLAYAVHNHALGYCQSMTFIVGRLLCLFTFHGSSASATSSSSSAVVTPVLAASEATENYGIEEQVFWMLTVFCEQFFPTYYTKGMAGLQVDGLVLEFLMRKRLPKVYRHLQQLQTPHIGLLLVTQWLLPICCAVFPSETSFRMMDVLLFEGSRAVFALAIALLRISQHEILAETKDYMQLFRFLKDRDMRLYDTELLLEVAFEEHAVVQHEIEQLRQRFKDEIDPESAAAAAVAAAGDDVRIDGGSTGICA